MKWICSIVMLVFTVQLMAQRPLSKRDQKAKEEFEALIAAEEKYKELIENADRAFKANDYLLARMTFQEASQYNPEMKQWLISKVNDLDILMAKNAARSVDSIYVKVPIKSVQLMQVESDQKIQSRSLQVPDLKVVSAEPAGDPIINESPSLEIEPPIEAEMPAVKKEEVNVVKQTPSAAQPIKEEKVKEDFSQLDNGITEETFNLTNHEVIRIVVKKGIDVKVFKRVKHNWGGEFYFLDGMDVSKRYWLEQVDLYRVKFAK